MKILDRFLIIVFNICLTIFGIWISVIPIAKSEKVYQLGYELCDMYSHEYQDGETVDNNHIIYKEDDGTINVYYKFDYIDGMDVYQGSDPNKALDFKVILTDDQINQITKHIITYLFENVDDFGLKLDVRIYDTENGFYTKNVNVFGEKAIQHMHDVKMVFIAFQIICVVSFVFGLGLFAYLLLRIGQIRHIVFEYTMFFHAIFFTTISILFMIVLVGTIIRNNGSSPVINDFMIVGWTYMHYLFFPFQGDKVTGSILMDILPQILDVKIFIMMTIVVVTTTISLQLVWLAFTLIVKIFGGQIGNKIKQTKYSSKTFTE